MTPLRATACAVAATYLVLLTAQPGAAQGRRSGGPPPTTGQFTPFDPRNADPMAGPVITGAPFSADATTTVVQTLADGTKIEQRSTARFYRDGSGRLRREQTIIGLDALNPSATSRTAITFDSVPGDTMPYVLDPMARTARRMPRGLASATLFGGYLSGFRLRTTTGAAADLVDSVITFQGLPISRRGVPNDLRSVEEQLQPRQIEGLRSVGRRTTTTIPQGRIGNDRPIQITDERWESPDLSLLIYSRYSDPRTGVVEYRLTNITRTEPRADLFAVPSDYTELEQPQAPTQVTPPPPPNPGGPATRGGRRGGRSPDNLAPQPPQ